MKFLLAECSCTLSIIYKGYEISISDHRDSDGLPAGKVDIRVYDEDSGDDITSVICRILRHTQSNYIEANGDNMFKVIHAICRLNNCKL